MPLNREQFAAILARALPESAYASIIPVPDDSIPDYPSSAAQAYAVYQLYRAGLLIGSGDAETMGWFLPNQMIRRSEVSAILHRLLAPDRC